MFVKVASKIMIMVHFVCLATTLIETMKVHDRGTLLVTLTNIHQF